MKILYGITKSNFGGAQRYVYDLALEAKRRGHEVVLLSGRGGKLSEKLKDAGVKTISLPSLERDISLSKELESFAQIVKVLEEEKPDVFHINSSKMGGLGALAARLAGTKKIIFTAHGWAFNEPRPGWQKFLIKFVVWCTLLLSHKTISVSEKTKKDIIDWPFMKRKVAVITNGVPAFKLPGREDQTFTVGTLSELHKIKGLDILLRAWSKFIRGKRARLLIAGEGEERQNLENMAKNMGISDSVVFKGFVENARSLLSEFDIFVIPSRSEAMPYALLEAGFAKRPVIATEVGGVPEVIENGLNGILVKPEDSEALFSSLALLAGDQSLRERLGENLKATIKEKFSFEKMAEETFKIYS